MIMWKCNGPVWLSDLEKPPTVNHIMNLKSKLPSVGTTIFTVMSGLATKTGAINLGQGFPDFPMDAALVELVNKAMKDGFNQYCLLYTSPSPRDGLLSRMPSS